MSHNPNAEWNLQVQEAVVHARSTGLSFSQLAQTFSIPRTTVRRWVANHESGKPLGLRRGGGRKRKLSDDEAEQLYAELDADPDLSNQDLAAKFGNKIVPRSVSNYVHRADPEFTMHLWGTDEAASSAPHVQAEGRCFYDKVQRFPLDTRVYQDETFVYDNETPKRGRARKGTKIVRRKRRRGKRFAFALAMTRNGLVHPPTLIKENFDDATFKAYALDTLLPHVSPGSNVFWDRLGRAGRKAKPDKQHYNPEVHAAFAQKGATVRLLPPQGKFYNPCELAAGFLKEDVRRQYKSSAAKQEARSWRFDELQEAMSIAASKITPHHCAQWFKERANGRAFKEAYPHLFEQSK